MRKKNTLYDLLKGGGISVGSCVTPAGEIWIIADYERLKATTFRPPAALRNMADDTRSNDQLSLAKDFFAGYNRGLSVDISRYLKQGLCLDLSPYTEKQRKIYHALVRVPWGGTITYGELSARAGIAGGARFAGNAMAANRFPVILPCHRVVVRGGKPGSYSGGDAKKVALLQHEGVLIHNGVIA